MTRAASLRILSRDAFVGRVLAAVHRSDAGADTSLADLGHDDIERFRVFIVLEDLLGPAVTRLDWSRDSPASLYPSYVRAATDAALGSGAP